MPHCPLCGGETATDDRVQFANGAAFMDEEKLDLSGAALLVFRKLWEKRGSVVTREALMDYLYDWRTDPPKDGIIPVYIHTIRKAVDIKITTVWGVGYMAEKC